MALESNVLAQQIVGAMIDQMAAAHPDIVKGVSVSEIPQADGTVVCDVTENRGPAELDPAQLLPFATAIATAVVEHIKAHAEVADTDPSYGGTWRVS